VLQLNPVKLVLQVQLILAFGLLHGEHLLGGAHRDRVNFVVAAHHADDEVHFGVLIPSAHQCLTPISSNRVILDVDELDRM